jgi:hypothetical protein
MPKTWQDLATEVMTLVREGKFKFVPVAAEEVYGKNPADIPGSISLEEFKSKISSLLGSRPKKKKIIQKVLERNKKIRRSQKDKDRFFSDMQLEKVNEQKDETIRNFTDEEIQFMILDSRIPARQRRDDLIKDL